MKKYFKVLLVTLLVILTLIIDSTVYAKKSVVKECNYWADVGQLSSSSFGGTFTIYDNGNTSFKITNVNGKDENNSEKVLNWNDIKSTFLETNKCPSYAIVSTKNTYKVYLFYDKLAADNLIQNKFLGKKDEFYITPGSTSQFYNTNDVHTAANKEDYVPSNESYEQSMEGLQNYILEAKGYTEKDYSTEECENDFYVSCEHGVNADYSVLTGHKQEIDSMIASGILDNNDAGVKEFHYYYDSAVNNMSSFKKDINTSRYGDSEDYVVDFGSVIEETCEGILGPEFLSFLNTIFKWIKIVVPILIVLLGSVDFAGSLLKDDKDALNKAISKFIKRLIVGVVIFLVTVILTFILNIFNDITNENTTVCNIGKINLIK